MSHAAPISARLRLLALLLLGAFGALGCKQGPGELCDSREDCEEGLICCGGGALSNGRVVRRGICLEPDDPRADLCDATFTGDAGVQDAGPVEDAGLEDDAGSPPEDAGTDAGPADAGIDAGPEDAGTDAGPADAGPPDAGPSDAGPDAA